MIDKAFFQRIGLNEDQISILTDALNRESQYRKILLQEGISPGVVENVIRVTGFEEVDLDNEKLLREKVRAEWKDFIVK